MEDADMMATDSHSPTTREEAASIDPVDVVAGEVAAIQEGEGAGQTTTAAAAVQDDERLFASDSEAEEPNQRNASSKSRRRERNGDEDNEEEEIEAVGAASGDEGGPSDMQQQQISEQQRRREDMMRRIDLAAKGPRKRPRKKADETDLEAAADDEIVQMRDKMQQAAQDDKEANEEKRPATAKLRMLKEAVETLQKTGYQQAILDNNLLEAVRMWLEPLPDKSLPSLNIQRALFPLLERMYIDTTSLKMSQLGRLVLFYTRCDRVDRSIKRIAERLLETWSRPILKRSSSYRDRTQAVREYKADAARTMQRALQDSQAAARGAGTAASQRARIPESVTGNAFRYAPVSAADDAMDASQLARLAEKQRINKFKRSMAAAKR